MSTSNGLSFQIEQTKAWFASIWDGKGQILVLTGAGISAESGIPTFRGEEGYWRIGSRNYFPEELATRSAFQSMPDEVWGWYLYRRSVCRAAAPNAAHDAIARLETEFASRGEADRFVLVSQNVDGLHLRAGNTLERTYQIHGNIDFMRSIDDRDVRCFRLPVALGETWEKDRATGPHERQLLRCPDGSPARPHVLWFDESYDEPLFRYQSTLRAVEAASLVIVVGTSGATTLPMRVVQRAVQREMPLLVINRDPSVFSDMAVQSTKGHFVQGSATEILPAVVEIILARSSGDIHA
jgi:NAD-dependent deacetylase